MIVKFFEHDGIEKKYETDLQAIPRKGDWFVVDDVRGIVINVVWRLERYIDNDVAIYYMTEDEWKAWDEKKRQGRFVK